MQTAANPAYNVALKRAYEEQSGTSVAKKEPNSMFISRDLWNWHLTDDDERPRSPDSLKMQGP